MPNNNPIDASKVQWDSQPQIDPNKVQWDNESKPKEAPTPPTTGEEKSTEGGGSRYVDSVLNAHKDLDWVQRLYLKDTPSIPTPKDAPDYKEGQHSTHLLGSNGKGYVFPHVVNIDGKLIYIKSDDDAEAYARKTNSGIQFPDEEKANWFAANGYKEGTNVLSNTGKGNPLSEKSAEGTGLLGQVEKFGTPTGTAPLEKKDVYSDIPENAPLTLPNKEQHEGLVKKTDPNVFVTPESFPHDSQASQFLNKAYSAIDYVPSTPFSGVSGSDLGKLATKSFIGSAISTLHNSEQLGQVAEDIKNIDQDPAAISELPAKLGGIAFGVAGLTPPLMAFNTAIAAGEEAANKVDQKFPDIHASDYFQAITSPFQNQLNNHVFIIPSIVGGAPQIVPVKDITRGKQGLAELVDLAYYAVLAKGFHGTAEAIKENKVLTPEQRNEVAQAIGEVKETQADFSPQTLDKIPQDIAPEQKIEIAPLIEQKQKLEKSKENVDDAFHPAIDQQIEGKNQEISNIISSVDTKDLTDLQKKEEKLTEQHDKAQQKVLDKMEELKSKGTPFNESEGLKTLKQKEKDHSSHLKQVQDAIEKREVETSDQLQHKGTDVNRSPTETGNSDSNVGSGERPQEAEIINYNAPFKDEKSTYRAIDDLSSEEFDKLAEVTGKNNSIGMAGMIHDALSTPESERDAQQQKIMEVANDLFKPPKAEIVSKDVTTEEKLSNISPMKNGEKELTTDETLSNKSEPPKEVSNKEEEIGGEERFTAKGGNKIVDEDGQPLTLYHGSKSKIEGKFNKGKALETIHFTKKKGLAKNYGKIVNEANVSIKKPLIINREFDNENDFGRFLDKYAAITKEQLKKQGDYDGIELNLRITGGKYPYDYNEVIIFDDNQIKFLPSKEANPPQENVNETQTEVGQGKKPSSGEGEKVKEEGKTQDNFEKNLRAKAEKLKEALKSKAEKELEKQGVKLSKKGIDTDKLVDMVVDWILKAREVGSDVLQHIRDSPIYQKLTKQEQDFVEAQATELDKGDVTQITKAAMEREWQSMGIDNPYANQLARDFPKVLNEAFDKINLGEVNPDELARDPSKYPNLNPDTRNAILLIEKRRIQNLSKEAMKQFDEAVEKGDKGAEEEARLRNAALQDRMVTNLKGVEEIGTALGRGLNSLKMALSEDYDLVTMKAQERMVRGGKLTPEIEQQIKDLHDKIEETTKKYEDAIAKHEQELKDQEEKLRNEYTEKEFNKQQSAYTKRKAKRAQTAEEIEKRKNDIFASIKDKLKEQRGRVSANPIPIELIPDIAKLTKVYLDQGVNKLSDVVDKIYTDLKDKIEGLSKGDVRDALYSVDLTEKGEGKTEDQRIASYKKKEQEFRDRIAKGDFEKKKNKPLSITHEIMKAKANMERARDEWRMRQEQVRLKNRTTYEKVLDGFAKYERAIKLSNIPTLGKLFAAALHRITTTPIYESVGAVWSKILPKVADKAHSEGYMNVKAEGKALAEAWKSIADLVTLKKDGQIWKTLKTGKSDIDVLYGKKGDALPPEVLGYIGQLHGAIKVLAKYPEFQRAFEKITASYERSGVDVSDPIVQAQIGLEAYKSANRSIFLQDNRVSSVYQHAVNYLKAKDAGIASKAIGTGLQWLVPFVKVPTNIAGETGTHIGGAFIGGAKVIHAAFTKGLDNLTPEEADIVMRNLKKGSIGLAALAVGYFNPTSFGGLYQPDIKRNKDDVAYGGMRAFGVNVPAWMLHNPLYLTMQLGATVRRVKDYYTDQNKDGAMSNGIWAGALGLAEQVPFVGEGVQINKVFQSPAERNYFMDNLAKNTIDPAALQNIAEWTDKADKRKPEGLGQNIESGIPVLREKVPEFTPSFSEDDLKAPELKYFTNKGLSLPNTSLKYEEVRDSKTNTIKSISDYPKDIQDKYITTHTNLLKQKLKEIKDRGYAYVNDYGQVSINPPTSSSTGNPQPKKLDDLTKKQLAEVLHLSQSSATTKAKDQVFYGKSSNSEPTSEEGENPNEEVISESEK